MAKIRLSRKSKNKKIRKDKKNQYKNKKKLSLK
jgi:hypothetical protein